MELKPDSWLSGLFGRPVLRVDGSDGLLPGLDPESFYYAKVDTRQVETVRRLCAAGFYVVDVNVTFGLATPGLEARPAVGPVSVAPAAAAQREAVLDIAATCFQYSRFHLDPAVPEGLADRIKREWIANYASGRRGEALYAATLDGRVAGFLAVLAGEAQGRRRRIIDLVGVGRDVQQRGVGRALVDAFIERHRSDCDELIVGTQAANLPSMRLYQKAGFSIISTAYVLHRHAPVRLPASRP